MGKYLSVLLLCVSTWAGAQLMTIEGYIYESGNRGYMSSVVVQISDASKTFTDQTMTDKDGHFSFEVPKADSYNLSCSKNMYEPKELTVESHGKDKQFVKVEMDRSPGYLFEITIAEKRDHDSIVVDAIRGTLIEVFNNTTEKSELVLEDHNQPEFSVPLLKNNHYTIMIRKKGYLTKRMEAFVNVKGCILCFEGVGDVRPGVVANLTEGNELGVLLANVELERSIIGKTLPVENIFYKLNDWHIDSKSKSGLKNLAVMLNDNPFVTLELRSHTDSRGGDKNNLKLSRKRAEEVVRYLIDEGVPEDNLRPVGYGETALKNNCRDGVKCSEEEHAINRRTELVILSTSDAFNFVPLEEMKRQERMEAMIEELSFGEQVKMPADMEGDSTALAKLGLDNDKTLEIQEEVITTTTTTTTTEDSDDSTVIVEPEMKVQSDLGEYTGYKICILTTEEPIATDHPLTERHSELKYYQYGDTFLYLIGEFDNLDASKDFLTKTAKVAYPKSKIYQFENGVIVE